MQQVPKKTQIRFADKPSKPLTETGAAELLTDNVDIDSLLTKTLEILRREISNLMIESSGGKLNNASARDLVSYVKLLGELSAEQQRLLKAMTEEQLK